MSNQKGQRQGKIALPNEFHINTSFVDANQAFPTAFNVQRPGEIRQIVIGGWAKEEPIAGMIAAQLAPRILVSNDELWKLGLPDDDSEKNQQLLDEMNQRCQAIAHIAATLARNVLAECKATRDRIAAAAATAAAAADAEASPIIQPD